MNVFITSRFSKIFLFLFLVFSAVACQQASTPPFSEVFAPHKKAINGYDPVAFFTESKPVLGSDQFSYEWKDVSWNFASQQDLDAFKADPEKYAPQYGGYCAYGTAKGHKAPTEADTWTIVNGKLYFNYNNEVKKKWSQDRASLIQVADTAWPRVKLQK